ncbi:diguanylate cyclase (GGDEF)-like protein [Kaistia hirudinis]|uniref:Diguanylate cyclase (GGDEF)-like protein n=1 Tax=Kaistia hirudinis TaxID=1293440 RepID=A0A840AXI2_9HYPH|nr:diguanylate cyclase (GGDEF)-like protein [Kaistia hirudinis]
MDEFLRRAAATRALTYEQLHILLDALPVAVSWATLADRRIRFQNRSFKTIFGYADGDFETIDEFVAKTYLRDADRALAIAKWQSVWAAERNGISEIDAFELEIRCADGSVRPVQHRGIILPELGIAIAVYDDISERKKVENALRQIAFTDPLTGLSNRRVLQDRWNEKQADPAEAANACALLLIDLDGFKAINDRLGHEVGDAALVAVAERLSGCVSTHDLVCRLGGDEFVIFVSDLRLPAQVEQMCWRILSTLALPWSVRGHSVELRATIGASLGPHDGNDLRALLRRADEALYRCKLAHRGTWQWFNRPEAA